MVKGKEPETRKQPGRKKIPALHAIRKPGQRTLLWPQSTAPPVKTDIGEPGPSTSTEIVDIEDDEMEDDIYSQPTIDGTCPEQWSDNGRNN